MGDFSSELKFCSLNLIDLSSKDFQSSVSLLKQACLDSGFFYVVNHGIDDELIDEVFSQSKRFFSLPLDEKVKNSRNEKRRGYGSFADYTTDGDYKESYLIGDEISEDHPDAKRPFCGPNIWPPQDILPGWRKSMERFQHEALKVAKSIARLLALALDLKVEFFDQLELFGTLRLLRYQARVDEGIFGFDAHCDWGLITILASDVIGLQICKEKDAKPRVWEYVAPIKGALVVNLGDTLELSSNGKFRSTLHRVLTIGQEKYSIAFFVQPHYDYIIECLPTCRSESEPPKFVPIKYEDYLLDKCRKDMNSYKD